MNVKQFYDSLNLDDDKKLSLSERNAGIQVSNIVFSDGTEDEDETYETIYGEDGFKNIMNYDFFHLLIIGSIKDPILWILSLVISSNVISSSFHKKLFYLSIAGIIWGYIRLYVYKSFGQQFNFEETLLLLLVCLLLMISVGIIFYFLIRYLKSSI